MQRAKHVRWPLLGSIHLGGFSNPSKPQVVLFCASLVVNNSYHSFHKHFYVIVTSLLGGRYYLISQTGEQAEDTKLLQGQILTQWSPTWLRRLSV